MNLTKYLITVRQTHVALITFGIFIGFSFNFLFETQTFRTVVKVEVPKDGNCVAEKLFMEVTVLCWVLTYPTNHRQKASHIQRTWGKRCNKLLFMSTETDDEIGAIKLPVTEGREYLWAKTKEAIKYIYKHHLNDYDWFLKVDDDTYVIVENLRFMLRPYASESPIYFGCKFKPFVKQGYMGGGPGYVLSREAVRRFVEIALPNKELCLADDEGSEDIELGKCMENINVTAGDSRDINGKGRFFPFPPKHHLNPVWIGSDSWYWNYSYYEASAGVNCCSHNAISFHYIDPEDLYVLDYLIYELQPYGINQVNDPLDMRIVERTSVTGD
ncbi:Glycoprotein-N-acetylgalactosamine 3-beta-galactosyltransferase 1 [Pseudolycoriella hygida]|uniref:Glycoprotein-N-acetylgalactosamine 3-beta-galactosyltransferase 1 n=1 Tax=Pseudolycoriella hygida TaxID=35572 RepID=A0A9Q0N630_9DIPT|nr:Glycoprotein-N-acetylgalactosamine 3-beta-galactosyltransferase 1 [Pseudolycoriella hygida]